MYCIKKERNFFRGKMCGVVWKINNLYFHVVCHKLWCYNKKIRIFLINEFSVISALLNNPSVMPGNPDHIECRFIEKNISDHFMLISDFVIIIVWPSL